ncbi:MAG: ATP-grasp domain-containing protein [Patescibacteria group bacterium]|nr:ATP-grasp domain-containing protein [Patescibacteria group bacterium]
MKTSVEKISSITDVKKILAEHNVKIYGIGGLPTTRSEIWPLIDDFELICANKTGEFESVARKVKIKYFQFSKTKFVKKPDKILSDKKVIRYIKEGSKGKKVGIYVLRPTEKIHEICNKNGWTLIANSEKLYNKLEDRLEFFKILKKIGLDKEFCVLKLSKFEKKIDSLLKKFGNKIVVQFLSGGGGIGTFFITGNEDKRTVIDEIRKRIEIAKNTDKNPKLIVSKFIEGSSVSVSGCVTKDNGILTTHAQYQLIDINESVKGKDDAQGVFCGNDWEYSNRISYSVHNEAEKITKKVGKEIKKRGYLGIFGIDFMLDKERKKLVPIELNPRLLGTLPVIVYVQLDKKEVPIVAFHLLEFLKIPYSIKNKSVYKKDRKRAGTHLIIFNPLKRKIRFKKDIPGGVYKISNGSLIFVRKGVEMEDLRRDNEFILTDGVPVKGFSYSKNRKILRIITKRSIATNGGGALNKRGRNIAEKTIEYIKNNAI